MCVCACLHHRAVGSAECVQNEVKFVAGIAQGVDFFITSKIQIKKMYTPLALKFRIPRGIKRLERLWRESFHYFLLSQALLEA